MLLDVAFGDVNVIFLRACSVVLYMLLKKRGYSVKKWLAVACTSRCLLSESFAAPAAWREGGGGECLCWFILDCQQLRGVIRPWATGGHLLALLGVREIKCRYRCIPKVESGAA